ncbi:hypothetical protein N657DRAFT_229584 [Parathielavia appendiculata]|uniref:Uncharacterized protein n=1 Tax=Parathielavia appendiculata TaxID=2587402 RepID=A0AAN6U7D3_9PEZI|nr:hypothetical protein N657DRAFT_229584 [Parathielavia appendiculata]
MPPVRYVALPIGHGQPIRHRAQAIELRDPRIGIERSLPAPVKDSRNRELSPTDSRQARRHWPRLRRYPIPWLSPSFCLLLMILSTILHRRRSTSVLLW